MTPAQDKDRNHLLQAFRSRLEAWLAAAAAAGFQILVYETFRTAERQLYLYGSGRRGVAYARSGPVLTRTTDSAHEYGCAADLVCLSPNGEADWSEAAYARLYAAVPPERYGLELLPWERPHLQLRGVNGPDLMQSVGVWAQSQGIRPNVILGSVWPLPIAPAAPVATGSVVFLRDMAGRNVVWDSLPTVYNGTLLTRYPDGALQLDRQTS
jgi:D-alanyl-D-alanine carboxypeptidase